MMLQRAPVDDRTKAAVARLTVKERECLDRWLAHATAKEIALDLGITHHAVEKRLKSARAKLGVTTTIEAARLLAAAKGYCPTVSQPSEVASSPSADQVLAVDPVSASPLRRTVPRIAAGVLIMSLIALTSFLVAGTLVPGTTPQTASAAPRVFTVNRSPNQKAELETAFGAAFAALDRNGDGAIAGEELSAAKFRVLRMQGAGTAALPEGSSLAGLDADRDGRVTRDEFVAGMAAMSRNSAAKG